MTHTLFCPHNLWVYDTHFVSNFKINEKFLKTNYQTCSNYRCWSIWVKQFKRRHADETNGLMIAISISLRVENGGWGGGKAVLLTLAIWRPILRYGIPKRGFQRQGNLRLRLTFRLMGYRVVFTTIIKHGRRFLDEKNVKFTFYYVSTLKWNSTGHSDGRNDSWLGGFVRHFVVFLFPVLTHNPFGYDTHFISLA